MLFRNAISVKQFGSRSGPTFVGPDLVPNRLQTLSTDDSSKQRVNKQNFGSRKKINFFVDVMLECSGICNFYQMLALINLFNTYIQ